MTENPDLLWYIICRLGPSTFWVIVVGLIVTRVLRPLWRRLGIDV